MVNPKKIEQKLPYLIADGPSIGFDYEEKDWWLKKLKRNAPDQFEFHRNKIINDFEALERDVLSLKQKKVHSHNGNGHQ